MRHVQLAQRIKRRRLGTCNAEAREIGVEVHWGVV
jgi:hypothetical protein